MIRLLHLLFFGHIHKWKIIKETRLTLHNTNDFDEVGHRYHLQCETCGDVSKRDLI